MTSTVLSAVVSSTTNPSRQPSDVASKAHHNKKGKGFHNPWPSWQEQSVFVLLTKMLRLRFTGQWNSPDTTPPTVPIRKPEFLPTRQTDTLRATWLGHACYFVEFPGGMRVLFDPVFTNRCSPLSWLGPKRFTEMPCQIEDIPLIDAVVISHNHYDHLSHPTIQRIQQKHKNVHFFVGLGNKAWFSHMKLDDTNVTEMDWWEERELTLSAPASEVGSQDSKQMDVSATFGCLPCQHISARTAFDRGHTLWASWSVTSGGKKVWFGGDTGYRSVPELPKDEFDYSEKHAHLPHCPAFKEIGDLRGPFDLGLIPIGAYDPRFIMSPMHANPYDSVNIFSDTKCKKALGIHWGTWVLTTEEVMEPPKVLKQALKWKGIEEDGVFETCEIERNTSCNNGQTEDEDQAENENQAENEDSTRSSIRKSRWRPPPAKRPDILMTLPPELRNAIYGIVLLSDETVQVGHRKERLVGGRYSPWHEPTLLRISKGIRAEASTVYYNGNDFVVEMNLSDIRKACHWFRQLTRRCGSSLFRSLVIYVNLADFAGLHYGRYLAKLFHETGLEVVPGLLPDCKSKKPALLHTSTDNGLVIEDALRAFIEVGRKASAEEWDIGQVDESIDTRVEVALKHGWAAKGFRTWKLITEV